MVKEERQRWQHCPRQARCLAACSLRRRPSGLGQPRGARVTRSGEAPCHRSLDPKSRPTRHLQRSESPRRLRGRLPWRPQGQLRAGQRPGRPHLPCLCQRCLWPRGRGSIARGQRGLWHERDQQATGPSAVTGWFTRSQARVNPCDWAPRSRQTQRALQGVRVSAICLGARVQCAGGCGCRTLSEITALAPNRSSASTSPSLPLLAAS